MASRRLVCRLRWWLHQGDPRFRAIATFGLVTGPTAHILVIHSGLMATEIIAVLR